MPDSRDVRNIRKFGLFQLADFHSPQLFPGSILLPPVNGVDAPEYGQLLYPLLFGGPALGVPFGSLR